MKLTVVLQQLARWRPPRPHYSSFAEVGELTKKYSNLPDSYIKRTMERVIYRTPKLPNYQPRTEKKCRIKFNMNRPWTIQSILENPLLEEPAVQYVEPIREWAIFRGDRVEVLHGPDKGKHGIVSQIYQERNWVTVMGLNMKLKVLRKEGDTPAVVTKEEMPLRVTDQVSLVDPSDMLPCKAVWRYTEKGERVRVSVRSGRIIPMPLLAKETYDYKLPGSYAENATKDTKAADVEKITFDPKLRTFEMDIMESMGIKEDSIPSPVYWY